MVSAWNPRASICVEWQMSSRSGHDSCFLTKAIHTPGSLGAGEQRDAGQGCSYSVSGEGNGLLLLPMVLKNESDNEQSPHSVLFLLYPQTLI